MDINARILCLEPYYFSLLLHPVIKIDQKNQYSIQTSWVLGRDFSVFDYQISEINQNK